MWKILNSSTNTIHSIFLILINLQFLEQVTRQ